MSNVVLSTRTADYGTDPSPQKKVNASNLDGDINALYNNDQALRDGLDEITRDDGKLKDESLRWFMLHPEVALAIASRLGWQPKVEVRAATTANITLSGAQTIDGVACVAGNRVLVKNQATQSQNGIYVVASGAWTRATDADAGSELALAAVFVDGGTNNVGTGWIVTATSITIGTTAIVWARLPGSGGSTSGGGGGGSSGTIVTVDSTYSVSPTDGTVLLDATGGAFVSTLPAADALGAGVSQLLIIKRIDTAGASAPTVEADTGDTIEVGTISFYPSDCWWLRSDGDSTWYVVNFYRP